MTDPQLRTDGRKILATCPIGCGHPMSAKSDTAILAALEDHLAHHQATRRAEQGGPDGQ